MANLVPLFANVAGTTLAGGITAADTSVTLATGTGALFPSPAAGQYFSMTFNGATNPLLREIVQVTARSGDVCTIVRAQEGTTAQAWSAGDLAANKLTAGTMAAIVALAVSAANSVQDVGVMRYLAPGQGFPTVPADANFAYVELQGAGGGGAPGGDPGGSAVNGGSGGAGGFVSMLIPVTPGATLAAPTIGIGGTSTEGAIGSEVVTANPGGDTSFNGLTAHGGGGGAVGFAGSEASAGGLGGLTSGAPTVGILLESYQGGDGTDGSTTTAVGGVGGASRYGGGARAAQGGGLPGRAPGSGGGATYSVPTTTFVAPGGKGADGRAGYMFFNKSPI